MIKKLVVVAFAVSALLVPMGAATAQEGPCATNYFPEEDMWEITWGQQFDSNDAATFTQASYGGLIGINDGPVPSYITDNPDWTWLYVTGAQVEAGRTVTYHFADETLITAVVSADGEGCPAVVWTVGQELVDEVPVDEEPVDEEPTPVETDPPAAAPVAAAPTFTG